MPAPPAFGVEWSRSAHAGPRYPRPAPASAIPHGGPTTERPGPRWSASSPTCCAAVTVAAAPGSAGWCAWPRTGSSWLQRPTWPASPPSGCAGPPAAGRYSRPDGGDQPRQLPGNRYLNAQNTYNSSENTGHLGGGTPTRSVLDRAVTSHQGKSVMANENHIVV